MTRIDRNTRIRRLERLNAAPVSISAVLVTGSGLLTLTFDADLQASSAITSANLTVCNGTNVIGTVVGTGTASGTTATYSGYLFVGVGCGPGATVAYDGGDANLKGANGLAVEAFADFPLTVV